MRNRFLLFRLDKGKIIYLFFVFFAVTTISQSMAQQLEEIKPIINLPTSPEASKLGTYGDINVNLYNGQPNINIPLYTIKENGIEIPITLSYSSSGIKVSEDASWVGLGWVLSGESAIVQEIRGQADEKDSDISFNQEYLVFRQRVEQQLVDDFGFMFQMGNQPDPPTNCGTIESYGWPYFDYFGDKANAMNAIIRAC